VATLIGQLEVSFAGNDNQAVAFHSSNGLRNGWPGLVESLGNASAHRHLALFFEFQDGPKIHLCCVD
jgi:hypothetical protein